MKWSTFATCASLLLSGAPASYASSIQPSGPIPDFASPRNADRPKFRYWFPDASISTQVIADDIKSVKDVGGGGLELLSFYNYGQGPPLTNWSTYGFGTPAFKEVLRSALNASAEHGLLLDFALGPNQGQGVPSVPETPGLAYELVYGVTEIRPGQGFSGAVPPANPHFNYEPLAGFINPPQLWGDNKLLAVVVAEVVSTSGAGSRVTKVLKESSALDLTNMTENGSLTWTPPAGNRTYSLFAFYESYTNEQNCISVPDAQTWIGNGSWMVDHFSVTGAKKDGLLGPTSVRRRRHQRLAAQIWRILMEMMASLWWTPGFLGRFQQGRGYSATKYLPVMFQASNLWNGYSSPYNTTYTFDTDATRTGGKYLQDYKRTLNEGYQDYLQHFQGWAVSLGLGHSAQPAYNLPLDMQADIPLVEAPELESLGFNEDIDLYRQFTGPAHLAGRNVISTEIGARRIGAYALTVPALVGLFQDSYAAGVNTMVIHGFPYSGDYVRTTWPGYTPFQYEFTEMWGPRMPAWRHFNDTMLYAARNTLVGKIGVSKVDLAFYHSSPSTALRDIYPGVNLSAAGYTREYLGPANLASPKVTASDGVLAADGPAYKAIVLYNQTYITSSASAALVRFARSGLPIIIVGSVPNTTFATDDKEVITANMQTLVGFPGVQVISASTFSSNYLAANGILPRVSLSSIAGPNNGSLYTHWRHDKSGNLDAVYVLNRGNPATFKLTFAVPSDSIPWELDAWTGLQTRVAVYDTTKDKGLSLNITLQQRQTTIFVFARPNVEPIPELHAVSHSGNVKSVHYTGDNNLEAVIKDNQAASITLSNGTTVTLGPTPSAPANITLGPWTLEFQSFEPSSNLSVQGTIKTLPPIALSTLVPWTQIPALRNLSGIGTYTTNFSLPSSLTSHKVILHLPPTLNTLRLHLNSRPLPPIDPFNPVVDVTPHLLPDNNTTLTIEVSSTLFNAIKSRLPSLLSAGGAVRVPEYYTKAAYAEFGLVGEVTVEFLPSLVVRMT